MMSLLESRHWISAILALAAGYVVMAHWPFPDANALLQLVLWHEPGLFYGIKYAYLAMCFTTPFIACSMAGSVLYIFIGRRDQPLGLTALPPYPDPARRERLFLILGETHHPKRPDPVPNPQWLRIPERGLYTGIMIVGAIGSGKTSGCMYPFAQQILGYRASDRARRIGGLVLEVKGDFCHKVRSLTWIAIGPTSSSLPKERSSRELGCDHAVLASD